LLVSHYYGPLPRLPQSVEGTQIEALGFDAFVAGLNIGCRVGKVALAKSLGLLRQDQIRFIEGMARVRNRYAHNVRNMHRSFVDILTEEQENNAKIVGHITGLMDTKLPAPKIAPYLEMFMYHRLADFLFASPRGSLFCISTVPLQERVSGAHPTLQQVAN
jgi:hypothetical protein